MAWLLFPQLTLLKAGELSGELRGELRGEFLLGVSERDREVLRPFSGGFKVFEPRLLPGPTPEPRLPLTPSTGSMGVEFIMVSVSERSCTECNDSSASPSLHCGINGN